jgi:hypothetical protein
VSVRQLPVSKHRNPLWLGLAVLAAHFRVHLCFTLGYESRAVIGGRHELSKKSVERRVGACRGNGRLRAKQRRHRSGDPRIRANVVRDEGRSGRVRAVAEGGEQPPRPRGGVGAFAA